VARVRLREWQELLRPECLHTTSRDIVLAGRYTMARTILRFAFGALLLGASLLGASAVADDDAAPINEEKVVVLTKDNFHSVVQSKEFVLVRPHVNA
jgi:hypothetical protein